MERKEEGDKTRRTQCANARAEAEITLARQLRETTYIIQFSFLSSPVLLTALPRVLGFVLCGRSTTALFCFTTNCTHAGSINVGVGGSNKSEHRLFMIGCTKAPNTKGGRWKLGKVERIICMHYML